MGWRTATTRFPLSASFRQTRRVVWLLPLPVLVAQMETTGTLAVSMVVSAPRRRKSAPVASTSEARRMTYSWLTSE